MPEPSFVQRFWRERALSRYLAALERGDINGVIAVLDQAARDGALERMIFDLHETYQTEEEFLEMVQEVQDEPDVVEIENGVFKSRQCGKLPDLKRGNRRKYRVYERVVQTLVACLLIICVLGSVFVSAEVQQSWQSANRMSVVNSCVTTGAPISAYSGTPVFSQIVAVAPDDIWILGNLRNDRSSWSILPLLEHWNGMRWSVVPGVNVMPLLKSSGSSDEAFLSHLAVISADDIWAVGGVGASSFDSYNDFQFGQGQPLIEHWDGHRWQLVPDASGITASYSVLNDLVAISANNIWAVGYQSDAAKARATALIEHWDGSRWTRVQQKSLSPQVGVLDEIRATSASDIWAFGRSSPLFQNFPLVEHWDGHNWSAASLSDTAGLGSISSVAALSPDNIWIAGSAPLLGSGPAPALIVHWDGQSWRKVADAKDLGAGNTLLGIKVSATNDIWTVGSAANGHALIEHWDGHQWNSVQHPSPAHAYLADITISGSKIWAVGGIYSDDLSRISTGAFIETSC